MDNLLVINSSPHIRSTSTTPSVMLDVLIAMVPALVVSVVLFGVRALVLSAVCVVASVLFEYLYRKLMKLDNTVRDFSAAITGLLIAFNLPVAMPIWMAVVGCFVAIVIVKQLFGGLGKNFANPAITARVVLLVSFATPMTTWTATNFAVDATSSATPLALAATGDAVPSYMDLFVGNISGSLGEVCKIALIIGGIYLVVRRVITITTPLVFVGTVFVLSWLLGADPVYQILSGGLILGAIFMATDYVTSPTTERGKFFFALGCGIITVVIRLYAGYPEGVSFAILLMNIVTPHIDRLCNVKAFGGVKA